MIFSGSMEFEKRYNQEVQERPSDNVELPKVIVNSSNLCSIGSMYTCSPIDPVRVSSKDISIIYLPCLYLYFVKSSLV